MASSSFWVWRMAGLGLALLGASVPMSDAAAEGVTFQGQVFVNHGLVGVGRIPAATRDQYGETVGSFSGIGFEPGSWKRNADGTYAGMLHMQPDRGYATDPDPGNWRPRFFRLAVTFAPDAAGAGQNQVQIALPKAVLLGEKDGTPLSSREPTGIRPGSAAGFPPLPVAPNGRIAIDAEGVARLPGGSFYLSDEFGPYLYRFSADAKLQSVIRPPDAFIPRRNGADSFATKTAVEGSPVDPDSGRQNNQGFEGLSLSPDGRTLFALLQSALRQDGGTADTVIKADPAGAGVVVVSRFNTRLLAYDISGARPVLKGEYVLQLPTYTSVSGVTRVAATSEVLALSNTQFLVLVRDSGMGHGAKPDADPAAKVAGPAKGGVTASADAGKPKAVATTPAAPKPKTTSVYRAVLLYSIAGATNLAGSRFDNPANPVAPGGKLDASVKPATRSEFINLNDPVQLAKFGLHNGPKDDDNNLSEKWESLALVPALDPAARNDYFLFVGNDNDFVTQHGLHDNIAYADASGVENDSMLLVFRLTLPAKR